MGKSLEIAHAAARRVGSFLLESIKKGGFHPGIKDDLSAVTLADAIAEKKIIDLISAEFPEDEFLSEETHPRLIERSDTNQGDTWVIDPLDGTTNFILGLPIWGVSICRLKQGLPVSAVLYFPVADELYEAEAGEGARMNGHDLQVSPPNPEQPFSCFACCSRTFQRYLVDIPYKLRVFGSAIYTFCQVARGSAIVGFEATPKVWDLAGAWLIVREAGGTIECIEGDAPFPLVSGLDYSKRSYPTLATSTKALWDKTRMKITPRG